MSAARWVRGLMLVALCTGPWGCQMLGCHGDALAELVQHGPGVQRDVASAQQRWTAAVAGDRFEMGDGLRTPPDQRAELSLFPSGGMRVEAGTLVRFQATPPGETTRRVRVDSGEISLDTGGLEIDVDTGDGLARVARGSRVRVGTAAGSVTLRVEVGRLQMERDGQTVTVEAGQDLTVEVGQLELETASGGPGTPEGPDTGGGQQGAAVDAGPEVEPIEPPVTADAGVASAVGPGLFRSPPERTALLLQPGEVATVHDPSPPTAIGIPVPCAGMGTVELGRGPGAYDAGVVRQRGPVHVRLQPGSYRYRVRCDGGGKPTQGRVAIRRDAGKRALPRRPPRVTVDADGRPYTVRYQNRLPELTFVWPGAPDAASYALRVTDAGGRHVNRTGDGPRLTVPSGKLREGRHEFVFEAAGTRSRRGVLKIDFDNTARAAYLSSPPDGVAPAGSQVRVAGAAVAGSSVSLEGQALHLSPQGRFAVELPNSPARSAVAVRVRHARGGVHYYLRHLTSPSPTAP